MPSSIPLPISFVHKRPSELRNCDCHFTRKNGLCRYDKAKDPGKQNDTDLLEGAQWNHKSPSKREAEGPSRG